MESNQENTINENISSIIGEFKGGDDLKTIAQRRGLFLPVLLRQFLRSYYQLDLVVVKAYMLNPALIPDERLRQTVGRVKWIDFTPIRTHSGRQWSVSLVAMQTYS